MILMCCKSGCPHFKTIKIRAVLALEGMDNYILGALYLCGGLSHKNYIVEDIAYFQEIKT